MIRLNKNFQEKGSQMMDKASNAAQSVRDQAGNAAQSAQGSMQEVHFFSFLIHFQSSFYFPVSFIINYKPCTINYM